MILIEADPRVFLRARQLDGTDVQWCDPTSGGVHRIDLKKPGRYDVRMLVPIEARSAELVRQVNVTPPGYDLVTYLQTGTLLERKLAGDNPEVAAIFSYWLRFTAY